MLRYHAFLLIGTLAALAGCDSNQGNNRVTPGDGKPADARPVTADDVKRANREAAETDAKYLAQKKEEYRKELQHKLDQLNQQMAGWNEKIKQAMGQAKQKLIEERVEVQKKRDAFAEKLKELDAKSGAAWQDMKAGLGRAYDDLKEAVNKANEHFK